MLLVSGRRNSPLIQKMTSSQIAPSDTTPPLSILTVSDSPSTKGRSPREFDMEDSSSRTKSWVGTNDEWPKASQTQRLQISNPACSYMFYGKWHWERITSSYGRMPDGTSVSSWTHPSQMTELELNHHGLSHKALFITLQPTKAARPVSSDMCGGPRARCCLTP